MVVLVLVICSTLSSGHSDDVADWTLSPVTSCGGAFFVWGISLPRPSRPLPDPYSISDDNRCKHVIISTLTAYKQIFKSLFHISLLFTTYLSPAVNCLEQVGLQEDVM